MFEGAKLVHVSFNSLCDVFSINTKFSCASLRKCSVSFLYYVNGYAKFRGPLVGTGAAEPETRMQIYK